MTKADLITEQFLNPIGELTKRQDNFPVFAERLASQVGDVTPNRLATAVDYVMARWKQKTFPTFVVLKEALDAACAGVSEQALSTDDEQGFFEAANSFCEARKRSYAAVPYSMQWNAWLDYHEAKGHVLSVRRFLLVADNGFWNKDGVWIAETKQACPCEWPWDFDKTYPSRQTNLRS